MPCTMISSNKTFRSFIWRTLSSFLAISFAAYYVTTDFFVGARKHQDQGSARTDEGSPSRALSAHTRARSLTANQQKEDLWVISPMLLAGAVVDAGWAFRAVMDTMLEHINNSTTILPNHKLRLVYVDEKCIPKYGIEAFWNATIHQEYMEFPRLDEMVDWVWENKVGKTTFTHTVTILGSDVLASGLIKELYTSHLKNGWHAYLGPGCSPASQELSREMSNVFGIPHVSHTASKPQLNDRTKYPFFWRTNTPDGNLLRALLTVLLKILKPYPQAESTSDKIPIAFFSDSGNSNIVKYLFQEILGNNLVANATNLLDFLGPDLGPNYGINQDFWTFSKGYVMASTYASAEDRFSALRYIARQIAQGDGTTGKIAKAIMVASFAPDFAKLTCELYKAGVRNIVFFTFAWIGPLGNADGTDGCTRAELEVVYGYTLAAGGRSMSGDAKTKMTCAPTITPLEFQRQAFDRFLPVKEYPGQLIKRSEPSTIPKTVSNANTGLGYSFQSDMGAGAEAVCIVAKMFHHMLYDRNYTANQLVPPILRPAGAAKITLREFWPTFLEMQDSIANMQWDGVMGRNLRWVPLGPEQVKAAEATAYAGQGDGKNKTRFAETQMSPDLGSDVFLVQYVPLFDVHGKREKFRFGPLEFKSLPLSEEEITATKIFSRVVIISDEKACGMAEPPVSSEEGVPGYESIESFGYEKANTTSGNAFWVTFSRKKPIPTTPLPRCIFLQRNTQITVGGSASTQNTTPSQDPQLFSQWPDPGFKADVADPNYKKWLPVVGSKISAATIALDALVPWTKSVRLNLIEQNVGYFSASDGKVFYDAYHGESESSNEGGPTSTSLNRILLQNDVLFPGVVGKDKVLELSSDEAAKVASFPICSLESKKFDHATQSCKDCEAPKEYSVKLKKCKCPRGYIENALSQNCEKCPRNTFYSDTTETCMACLNGYISEPGQFECTPCQVGYFLDWVADVDGVMDKNATKAEKRKARQDVMRCRACPHGMVTLNQGSSNGYESCVCPDGTYLSPMSATCVVCPEGVRCEPKKSATDPRVSQSEIYVKREYYMPEFTEPLQVYACAWNSATLLRLWNEASVDKREGLYTPCPGYKVGMTHINAAHLMRVASQSLEESSTTGNVIQTAQEVRDFFGSEKWKRLTITKAGASSSVDKKAVSVHYDPTFKAVSVDGSMDDPSVLCAEGRESFVCGRCKHGFNENTSLECDKCEPGDGWPIPAFLAFGFLIALPSVYYFTCGPPQPRPDPGNEVAQLAGSFFLMIQLFGVIGLLGVTWSADALALFAATAVTTGETRGLMPMCIFGRLPLTSFLMKPVVILVALIWAYNIPIALAFLEKLVVSCVPASVRQRFPRLKNFVARIPRSKDARTNVFGKIYLVSFIPVVKTSVAGLDCYAHPGGSRSSLKDFPSVVCYEGDHLLVLVVSLICLFLFAGCWFVFLISVLRTLPEKLLTGKVVGLRYKFLCGPWTPSKYYWGVIQQARNMSLALFVVLPLSVEKQILLISILFLVYQVALLSYWPWKCIMANLFDILICVCVVILMIGAGMLIGDGTAESLRSLVGFGVYLVFSGATTAMASGMLWVLYFRDKYQARAARRMLLAKKSGQSKGNNKFRGSLVENSSSNFDVLIEEFVRFATMSSDEGGGIKTITQKISSLNVTEELEIKRWFTVLVFECSPTVDRAVTLRRIKPKAKAKAAAAPPKEQAARIGATIVSTKRTEQQNYEEQKPSTEKVEEGEIVLQRVVSREGFAESVPPEDLIDVAEEFTIFPDDRKFPETTSTVTGEIPDEHQHSPKMTMMRLASPRMVSELLQKNSPVGVSAVEQRTDGGKKKKVGPRANSQPLMIRTTR